MTQGQQLLLPLGRVHQLLPLLLGNNSKEAWHDVLASPGHRVKEAAGPSCAVVPVLHLKDGHTKRAVISILHSFLRNKPFGQEFPARRYLQVNGPEGGALGPGGERGGEGVSQRGQGKHAGAEVVSEQRRVLDGQRLALKRQPLGAESAGLCAGGARTPAGAGVVIRGQGQRPVQPLRSLPSLAVHRVGRLHADRQMLVQGVTAHQAS